MIWHFLSSVTNAQKTGQEPEGAEKREIAMDNLKAARESREQSTRTVLNIIKSIETIEPAKELGKVIKDDERGS